MAKLNYEAQNTIDSVGGVVLKAGDVVALDDADVIAGGSLILTEATPTVVISAPKKKGVADAK